MSIISKITVQKNKSDRYNIFIDEGKGDKYAFSVDEDVLIKFQLKKGLELDEFLLTEITYQDDVRKAYNQAIQYLARKMRSEYEVREYLRKNEIDEPIIQEVTHKLYEYQFLNDEEYAKALARTLMNTTDKGSDAVKRELKEKGISDQYIKIAMKEYPYEMEFEKAITLCQKFHEKNKKDSVKIAKLKLEQFLFRKGFRFEIISTAINETEVEDDKQSELEALRIQGEKALRKYSKLSKFEFEQKMKQTLYRKGFSIELIEEYLREIEE